MSKTPMRNESEAPARSGPRWELAADWSPRVAPLTDRSLAKDSSKSISVGTRKMVNYA